MIYYVSRGGSDLNDGLTPATPFFRMNRAAAAMQPGDVCEVMAGVYNEQVNSVRDGRVDAPITFRAYGNDLVIIDGLQNPNQPWGFFITHSYHVVEYLTIKETAEDCILILGNETPESAMGNIIRHCTLRDWGYAGGSYEMYGCAAVRCREGGSNTTIMNNIITRAKYKASSHEEAAIHFWETWGGHTVKYNFINGQSGSGYGIYDAINGGANVPTVNGGLFENSEVAYNIIMGCTDDAIEAEGRGANINIHHNVIIGGRSAIGLAPVDAGPVHVYRNLLVNQTDTIFKMAAGRVSRGAVRIYNNTCITHPTLLSPDGFQPNVISTSGGSQPVSNVTVVNNILWARRYILESQNASDEIWLDHNAVFSKERGRNGYVEVDPVSGAEKFWGPIKWHGIQYGYDEWVTRIVQADQMQLNGFYAEIALANTIPTVINELTSIADLINQYFFGIAGDSPAVDAGALLAGVTDGTVLPTDAFQNRAPDMGWLESPYLGVLVPDFAVDPVSGLSPLTVTCLDLSAGVVVSREWLFGDGTTGTGELVTHTYSVPLGSPPTIFTITLIVTDSGGAQYSVSHDITVETIPQPVAKFRAEPSTGPAPLEVTFYNESTGDIDTFQWSFGDGVGSNLASPTHVYTAPGTYQVTLAVTGPGGVAMAVLLLKVTSGVPLPGGTNWGLVIGLVGAGLGLLTLVGLAKKEERRK